MSAQTSYSINTGKYYEGQIYDLNARDVVTRIAEGVVAFGYAVFAGTIGGKQAKAGGTGEAAGFEGIALRSLDREAAQNTGDIDYKDGDAMAVMRDGYAVVRVSEAVVYNDTAVIAPDGSFKVTPAAGDVLLSGATYQGAAGAGELVVLRLPDTVVPSDV